MQFLIQDGTLGITCNGVIERFGKNIASWDAEEIIDRIEKFTGRKKFGKNEHLSTGLGTNTMQSHNTVLKKLELGKIKIENFEAILLDLKHVNESYEKLGFNNIDGVLGGEVLVNNKAVIDYGKKILKLKT